MTAAEDLLRQANAQFTAQPPNISETLLINNCTLGTMAAAGANANPADPTNNPQDSATWAVDRRVRGELIRWLCVNQSARALVDPKGIALFGARVCGGLDLSNVTVPFPLIFKNCGFENAPNLGATQVSCLEMTGSWVPSINAEEIKVAVSVLLTDGFHSAGLLNLNSGKIGGDLDCGGAILANPYQAGQAGSGLAMDADNISIGGNLSLNKGFRAEGKVHLIGAQIGGELSAAQGSFVNPPVAHMEVSGCALVADRATVKGAVFLGPNFRSQGLVSFSAARTSGTVDCSDANLENPAVGDAANSGVAFLGDNINVDGDMKMSGTFTAVGEVRLIGARISGDLYCLNGTFQNPLGGNPATFGDTLSCDGMRVAGDVFLKGAFGARGQVRFVGAQVGGDFDCTGASFQGPLTVQRSTIQGTMFLCGLRNSNQADINLIQTSVGAYSDDPDSWPRPGFLRINRFVYGSFSSATDDADTRLRWIDLQPRQVDNQLVFNLQPYQQLAKLLRDGGNNRGAQRVLYFMEMRRRSRMDNHWFAPAWSAFLRFTIGYGYYPTRPAIFWILTVTLLGTILYWNAYNAGRMVPTQADAYKTYTCNGNLPNSYERFHAFVFSFENSFPLVKLGQAGAWQPDPWESSALNDATICISCANTGLCSYEFLRRFQWVQILLGWFFSGMILAGVTGLVRKS